MTFNAVVGPFENQFAAALIGEPKIRAVGQTREAAVAALKSEVSQRVERGELIALDVEPLGITSLAGKYRDDPTLENICVEAYRERDDEIAE